MTSLSPHVYAQRIVLYFPLSWGATDVTPGWWWCY